MTFKNEPFEKTEGSFWSKFFKKKLPTNNGSVLIEKAQSIGQLTETILKYIRTVKSGKTSIIVGKDYVVMNREMYDNIVKRMGEEYVR